MYGFAELPSTGRTQKPAVTLDRPPAASAEVGLSRCAGTLGIVSKYCRVWDSRSSHTLNLSPAERRMVIDPVQSSEDMRHWAARVTLDCRTQSAKATALYEALVQRPNTNLPASSHVLTARETFEHWNDTAMAFRCQELSYIYVAMARSLGLEASVAEVEQDAYGIATLHSCAAVLVGDRQILVDPIYRQFDIKHKKFTILDDAQTTASYICADGTLEQCELACKMAPTLSLARINLFTRLLSNQRWHEADKQLAILVHLDPDGPMTRWGVAQMHLHSGNVLAAIAELKAATEKAPGLESLHQLLGAAHAQLQHWPQALASYITALECCTSQASAAVERKAIAATYYNKGRAEQEQANEDQALQDYTQAIKFDPACWQAFVGQALIWESRSDWSAALTNYERALQIQTNFAEGYVRHGLIEQSLGDPQNAVSDYSKALALDPRLRDQLAGSVRETAYACYNQHLFANAITALKLAAKLFPDDFETRFHLFLTRYWLDQRTLGKGELELFLRTKRREATPWCLAIADFLTGKTPEQSLLEAATDLGSPPAERICQAHFYAGTIRLIHGEKETATRHFQLCKTTGCTNSASYASALAELKFMRAK